LRIFSVLIFLCIFSVPFFETEIFHLNEKIVELENKKRALQKEITTLQFVKKSLARLEEKEKMLMDHYGMEKYASLKQVVGGVGNSDPFTSRYGITAHGDLEQAPPRRFLTPESVLFTKLKRMSSSYGLFNQLLVKQKKAWETTPSIIPVKTEKPVISSGFGWRISPFTSRREFHSGIDIIGPRGTEIIAPADGIVTTLGHNRWLGHYIVVQHNDEIKTIYGHLEKIYAKRNQRVNRGEALGLMGNTGLSTSTHLHYSITINDRAVDPIQYVLDLRG